MAIIVPHVPARHDPPAPPAIVQSCEYQVLLSGFPTTYKCYSESEYAQIKLEKEAERAESRAMLPYVLAVSFGIFCLVTWVAISYSGGSSYMPSYWEDRLHVMLARNQSLRNHGIIYKNNLD